MAYLDKYLNKGSNSSSGSSSSKSTVGSSSGSKPISSSGGSSSPSGSGLRLKLRKAYFCSTRSAYKGINSDGTLAILEGWVVMGFLGPADSKFIIPKTYNGLPIIGIHYLAYETLNEYEQTQYEGCYKESHLHTTVCFRSNYITFVFPPRRYSNRRRLDVDYFSIGTPYKEECTKNSAGFYTSCAFCFDEKGGLLKDLIRITGKPKLNGYWLKDVIYKTYTKTYSGSNKKEEVRVNVDLDQSTLKTYKTCHPLNWTLLDRSWPDNTLVAHYSWDMLHVGKYFRVPDSIPYNPRTELDNGSSVLCFLWLQAGENNDFVFNTVSGTDVIISCDSYFPEVDPHM